MLNNKLNEIVDNTYTKNDFYKRILLLKEFFEYFFFSEHEQFPLKNMLKKFLIEHKKQEEQINSMYSLSDSFYEEFTKNNFGAILNDLQKYILELPLITMYVPIVLPLKEVEKLGKWMRSNVAKDIFIDLKIDRESVGGCAFVWKGVYHDFSLKYFLNNKQEDIVTILRNYSDG